MFISRNYTIDFSLERVRRKTEATIRWFLTAGERWSGKGSTAST